MICNGSPSPSKAELINVSSPSPPPLLQIQIHSAATQDNIDSTGGGDQFALAAKVKLTLRHQDQKKTGDCEILFYFLQQLRRKLLCCL